MKDIKQQIDEMINMRTDPPGTESPGTTAPETQSPGTSAPETTAPETQAPNTTAPETTAPETEEPEETPEEKLARIEQENENLRKRLAGETLTEAPGTKAPGTKAPATKAPHTEPPQDIDFVGDIDLEELTADKAKFNKFLNEAFKQFTNTFQPKMQEGVLRSIPDIVKQNVLVQASLRERTNQFYEDNQDLKASRKFVANLAEEMIAEHPDWDLDTLFNEVEKEARIRLELPKKRKPGNKPPPKNPPTKRGARQQPKPDVSPLLKEIDAMNQDLQEGKR